MDQAPAAQTGAAATTVDAMLGELSLGSLTPAPKPPVTSIAKVSYTHDAMIDLIIENPWISQGEIAKHFGYTQAWISRILASDAFQSKLATRRSEIIDPAIAATVEERFKCLVIQSLEVLHQKLSQPLSQISDNVALRAAELGAKALGLGGHKPPEAVAPSKDRLVILSERLVELNRKTKEGAVYEINAETGELLQGGSDSRGGAESAGA